MTRIRPVSDLQDRFEDVESSLKEDGSVILTRNNQNIMVIMSMDEYTKLTGNIESKLDEADEQAASSPIRYSGNDVFARARKRIKM